MEIAVIDWKNIDSRFVRDDIFENFNAPQWVDFSAADGDPAAAGDDDSWFCRPDCDHPKTVEDFYRSSASSKLQRSASVSQVPSSRERNRRDANLKNRGQDVKSNRMFGDAENQNPNFKTPPRSKAKILKEMIKSSAEKEAMEENSLYREQQPRLRNTLSARNLFGGGGGGGLLNKVSEFCNELKKLASRAKEKENVENQNVESTPDNQKVKGNFGDEMKSLDEKQKERKPLLETSKDKSFAMNSPPEKQKERKPLLETSKERNFAMSSPPEKQKKKLRKADAENTPIRVEVKNIRHIVHENLSHIRTNPPTPQSFSATKVGTPQKTTPQSRPHERGILQELRQGSNRDNGGSNGSNLGGGQNSVVSEREARGLDVLWFLKPCTLSSSNL